MARLDLFGAGCCRRRRSTGPEQEAYISWPSGGSWAQMYATEPSGKASDAGGGGGSIVRLSFPGHLSSACLCLSVVQYKI